MTVVSGRDDFEDLFDLRFEESAGRVGHRQTAGHSWLRGFWAGEWFTESTHFDASTSGGGVRILGACLRLALAKKIRPR